MKKILTAVCAVIGIICGGLVNYFGHCNIMLLAFTIILILTYLTEWMKALYQKKKNPATGIKGILRMTMMIVVVGFSHVLQLLLQDKVPIRDIAVMFFISNLGLTLLGNAAVLIPLPQQLKSALLKLQPETVSKESEASESTVDKTQAP
jgi:toxin secretion/phage lysis holin